MSSTDEHLASHWKDAPDADLESEPEPERTPISTYFVDCISAFDRLHRLLATGNGALHADAEGKLEGVDFGSGYMEQLSQDLDSFRVWAGGCGAHRAKGKESLDYKLREALYVHDTVTGFLQELKEALEQGTAPDSGCFMAVQVRVHVAKWKSKAVSSL